MYGGIGSDRSEGALGRERYGGLLRCLRCGALPLAMRVPGVCTHGQGKVGAEPGAGAAGGPPARRVRGGYTGREEGRGRRGPCPWGGTLWSGVGRSGGPPPEGRAPPDPVTWDPPAWARGRLGEGPAWLPPWRGWGHAPPYLCPYWCCSSLHCFTSFSRLLFSVWAWHSPNAISLPPWCAAPPSPPNPRALSHPDAVALEEQDAGAGGGLLLHADGQHRVVAAGIQQGRTVPHAAQRVALQLLLPTGAQGVIGAQGAGSCKGYHGARGQGDYRIIGVHRRRWVSGLRGAQPGAGGEGDIGLLGKVP